VLNFAIVGCGSIGSRHAMQAAGFGKLRAVCDIVEERAQKLGESFGANGYSRLEDMLLREKGLDILAVCTPNGLHAEQVIRALRAGIHVICEKPMALKTEDCRQMIREAGQADKQLFVVKQNRFNPPVVAVKKMLDEGKLGRVFSVQVNGCWCRTDDYYRDSWHGTRDMDGGMLFTQFSHFIDLLYWMIGDIKEVLAYKGNFAHKRLFDFDDTVVASLRFVNETMGSLHFTTNSYLKNMEGSLMIVAENGTMKIGGQYLNTLEYACIKDNEPIDLLPGNAPNEYGLYQGSMSNHDKMYAHVVDVLTKGHPNGFGANEGLKTVEIIEKIYKAGS
jgi:UDP-N-acetyl-2-amino-2-deoxyglucuronate dehydrogenase